ncbi:RNA polymerase sigma factor [Candidatus Enterococcus testudinis]|nr:RNA polymerase sigma factor [Enterococcus sp. 8G7_MSG3316]
MDLLENMYHLYGKECYLYAFYFTKNTMQAEDLVSQAYLAILDALPFLQEEQIKYYLFKTIKNGFIDGQRKEKNHQKWRRSAWHHTKQDAFNTPLTHVIKEEERRTLYRSIDRLPEDTREVILLFYFMELSIDEIAKYKEWTYTQTKNRLYRGRLLLKEDIIHERTI